MDRAIFLLERKVLVTFREKMNVKPLLKIVEISFKNEILGREHSGKKRNNKINMKYSKKEPKEFF